MEPTSTTQPHFADYVRPIWSRKWLVVVAVLVATVLTYAYYARKADVYRAGTLVFVKDPGDPVSGVPTPQSTDRSVQNQASLLYSRDTAGRVAKRIGYDGSASDLLRRVSITSREGEDFVNVAATGRSADEAATIANAYAKEFVGLIDESYITRIERALDFSRTQLSDLASSAATSLARQNLSDQIARLEIVERVPPDIARQVDPALPPAEASEPRPLRNALFAFVLSLVLAIGVAFGLERFDRRLKRPEEIEQIYSSPLLAVLPHTDTAAPTRGGAAALGSDFQEPFRVLRTNIELEALDRPARTIVVSSATPGEGKSTVVRNLALAFHETGRRVAVVEGDLRHPALGALFGVTPGPGLTEVLRHDATLEEVTLRVRASAPGFDDLVRHDVEHDDVPVKANGAGRAHTAGGEQNGHANASHDSHAISVLLSGHTPANPPAVLASERLVEVLDELRASHDIVLIDSAPLLAVTDTVPLLRYADATLLVSRLGVTTRDTAKRVMDVLARVPDVVLLGVVANDLSRLEAAGYGYGYGYGYGPDAETAAPDPAGEAARAQQPA